VKLSSILISFNAIDVGCAGALAIAVGSAGGVVCASIAGVRAPDVDFEIRALTGDRPPHKISGLTRRSVAKYG